MTQDNKIIVTGANGFVGSALIPMLDKLGFNILSVVRTACVKCPVNQQAIGDYTDFHDWQSLMGRGDVIVHLAAMVHQSKEVSEQEYQAMNVDVTTRIAKLAREAGVSRFIFLSTVKVNGEMTCDGNKFSGTDEPAPEDAYGRSKYLAEKKLHDIFSGADTELVIIRPPLVYGPGVRANFQLLIKLARLPLPLPLASVCNKRDMVSVLNLSELIILCCTHPQASLRPWMVADQEPYSLPQLITEARALSGRSPGLFKFPPGLLKIGLALLGKSAWSRRLFADLQVDNEPTKQILGWVPRYDFARTMAASSNASGEHE